MLDPTQAKEVFDTIIKTEPKNRTWVLSVVINFILGIALTTTFFVFKGIADKAEEAKAKAETELAIQRASSIKDDKACNQAILEAVEKTEAKYTAKIENLQNNYMKDLKDRADKLDAQMDDFRRETKKLKNEARSINKMVKE